MSETEYPLVPDEDQTHEEQTREEQTREEQSRYVPGQPLPRLWKTEPDPEDDADEAIEQAKKASQNRDAAATAPRTKASATKTAKPKKKKADDESKGEKRVLLEETPTFDTIESRKRARMAVGGLLILCLLIFGWIVKGMIFSDSGELEGLANEFPPQSPNLLPAPGPSREAEARYMLDRAREYAKREQTDLALDKLHQIVSVYKGTAAAVEAQAALNRPSQNLPLFPERPFVLAEKTADSRPPASPASPHPLTVPPGPIAPGTTASPVPAPMPPPQVAIAPSPPGSSPRADASMPPGTSTNPGGVASALPTGPAPSPGNARPAPPGGPSLNPATVGPAPAPVPAMSPNIASAAPPPRTPGGGAGTNPTAPTPGPGTGSGVPGQPVAPPPPPGPGDVAILIPGTNGGAASATPPAGENAHSGAPADGGPTVGGRVERKLPPGFKAKLEAGPHESGWPRVIVGERDGATMVLVPGGTFTMGSDRGDARNRPAHSVRLSTYYIDQHEVTNRQFRTFLDDTHYQGQPPGKWLTDPKMRSLPDDAPAVYISYQDAEEYAIWGRKRLATEAQWEMAARSIDGRRSPWGDEPIRWSRPRKLQQIDPVMTFAEDVSPYGVFDLAGNAVEWVRDWYDPAYYGRLRDTTTPDPTGPPTRQKGIQRVVKGSSKEWLMYAREGMDSDRRLPFVSFRCSLAVEGSEASALIVPHPPKPNTPQPGTPPPGQGTGNDVPF
jgi:formylglycine-generating enzyme required for sulfatase activity